MRLILSLAALPSGYKLAADELERLLDSLDPGNTGARAAVSHWVYTATSCGCQPSCAAWAQLAAVLKVLEQHHLSLPFLICLPRPQAR